MYDANVSRVVVIGGSANPYLLIGKQGTLGQGKVFLQGLKTPIRYKNIESVVKSSYSAAVSGVWRIAIPGSPVAGTTLKIKAIGPKTTAPETNETVFANANIGTSESISQSAFQARVLAAVNNNKAFSNLFTASISGGYVLLTQVNAGVGLIAIETNAPSTVVLDILTQGVKNKGMTYAQVIAMANPYGPRTFEYETVGAITSADNFDVYAIQVSNFTGMNPFSFKENKPDLFLVVVDTDNTTFEAQFEALLNLTAATNTRLGGAIVASTGVITIASHGLTNGQPVFLESIASTTGITANTQYFANVINANTFSLAATVGGVAVTGTTDGTVVVTFNAWRKTTNYGTLAFADGAIVASTGVITKAAHGLVQGQKVFASLPGTTGIKHGIAQTYYVNVISSSTFTLSLTNGGAAVTGTTNSSAVSIYTGIDDLPDLDFSGEPVVKDLLCPAYIV